MSEQQRKRFIKRTARRPAKPGVPLRLQRAVPEEDLDSLVAQFTEADLVRLAAIKVLMTEYRNTEQKAESAESYKLPAFSEFQADCNATRRTIRRMLKDLFGVDIYGQAIRQEDSEEGEGQDQKLAPPNSEEEVQ